MMRMSPRNCWQRRPNDRDVPSSQVTPVQCSRNCCSACVSSSAPVRQRPSSDAATPSTRSAFAMANGVATLRGHAPHLRGQLLRAAARPRAADGGVAALHGQRVGDAMRIARGQREEQVARLKHGAADRVDGAEPDADGAAGIDAQQFVDRDLIDAARAELQSAEFELQARLAAARRSCRGASPETARRSARGSSAPPTVLHRRDR